MSRIAELRKSKNDRFKSMQEKLEKSNNTFERDERVWKPSFDVSKWKEDGKGQSAIVRFLPAKEGDPFVEVMNYNFKGKGGNFFGLALQTIGEKDPVQIASISMFKKAKEDKDENLKKQALKYLPKSRVYANVLVIKDDKNPENVGKVMIYEFGYSILNMIKKKIKPEFDEEESMDPFDIDAGAVLKIRMVGREIPDSKDPSKKVWVPNYDNSVWGEPCPLADSDDEMDKIIEKTYDLSDFVAPDKFKSFDEVAKRFEEVTGKPYNYLSKEGVEDHVEKLEKEAVEAEEESKVDNEADNDDNEVSGGDEDQSDSVSFDDDDDDPVAAFKNLLNNSDD